MFDKLQPVKATPVLMPQFLNYTRRPCVHSTPPPLFSILLLTMIEIGKKRHKRKSTFHPPLKQIVQFKINQNAISLHHDKEVLYMG